MTENTRLGTKTVSTELYVKELVSEIGGQGGWWQNSAADKGSDGGSSEVK